MRLPTLITLSVLGMVTSSVGVWALTTPSKGPVAAVAEVSPRPGTSGPGAEFDVPGTVHFIGRLGHPALPANEPNTTYLYAEMTTAAQRVTATPVPLDLAIVIDRSGSMRGQRLRNALDAARGTVDRLRDGDRLTVLAYDTTVTEIVRPTTIDPSTRGHASAAIAGITAAGDTCISCGIEAGLARLGAQSGRVRRLLLLSDGEATAGLRDEAGFRGLATDARERGVSITSIGVDTQYNERVLSTLALESNGRHYFVENADDLPAVFDKELAALSKTYATNGELVVTPAAGVTIDQVFDRTFRRDEEQVIVPLGNFSAAEQKTVLIKLSTSAAPAGPHPIAKVTLRYRDHATNTDHEDQGELALTLVAEPTFAPTLDPTVESRLNRSQASDALERANELYRAGRQEEARATLRRQLEALDAASAKVKRAPPSPSKVAVDRDYENQRRALESADDGFGEVADPAAAPPANPASPPPAKPAAQVRRNADWATNSRF